MVLILVMMVMIAVRPHFVHELNLCSLRLRLCIFSIGLSLRLQPGEPPWSSDADDDADGAHDDDDDHDHDDDDDDGDDDYDDDDDVMMMMMLMR